MSLIGVSHENGHTAITAATNRVLGHATGRCKCTHFHLGWTTQIMGSEYHYTCCPELAILFFHASEVWTCCYDGSRIPQLCNDPTSSHVDEFGAIS